LNPPEPPAAPFDEPWQSSAFALAVELSARGVFTWSEWAAALARQIAATPEAPYYEAWLAALETLSEAKGLTRRTELDERRDAWAHAYLVTPHGKPVELAP
jgi:nitrile hydratase accessory protein